MENNANRRTVVIRDNKVTVVTPFNKADGGQEYGTVSTTVQTNSTGLNPEVSIQTDYRAGAPRDNALCEELLRYADSMIEHWTSVKKTLTELKGMLVIPKRP